MGNKNSLKTKEDFCCSEKCRKLSEINQFHTKRVRKDWFLKEKHLDVLSKILKNNNLIDVLSILKQFLTSNSILEYCSYLRTECV